MASKDEPRTMFGPLSFPQDTQKSTLNSFDIRNDTEVTCLMCIQKFLLPNQQQELLTHLFMEHRLVIADVHLIGSLKSYLDYWRIRFSACPVTDFCSTLLLDSKPDGTASQSEQYFLLSDVLPEDKLLREGLQQKRLEWVLEHQTRERDDTNFGRDCLFCKLKFSGCRADYFNHLCEKHNLQLGRPQNLVFTDELLDVIQYKMDSLQCIFCEKIFKDRAVLKEHMRKKQHKRINPDCKEYDKFYIVNYLELGKDWQQVQKEPEDFLSRGHASDSEGDSDWSDWEDRDGIEAAIVCLFCKESDKDFDCILTHMKIKHHFDYKESCDKLGLNFYQQVKLVNYIRRQLHDQRCVACDKKFDSDTKVSCHMESENHCLVPHVDLWDQPEYYFPTYENDSFLCHLDDTRDDSDQYVCGSIQQLDLNNTSAV